MFTDIVSSTSLVEAIGDDAWRDLVRWHDETLRARFREHGGEEVDHAGDGFFVAFPSARDAVEAARTIQRTLAEHRRMHGFAPQVRIGLHATEASRDGAAYRGRGVHEAARIGALAAAGEVLASWTTLEAEGLDGAERREVQLKGLAQPVEVASVSWR
jgi:class 3 adenylate cyclase